MCKLVSDCLTYWTAAAEALESCHLLSQQLEQFCLESVQKLPDTELSCLQQHVLWSQHSTRFCPQERVTGLPRRYLQIHLKDVMM